MIMSEVNPNLIRKQITIVRHNDTLKRLDKIVCRSCAKETINACDAKNCEMHKLINELYGKTEIVVESSG